MVRRRAAAYRRASTRGVGRRVSLNVQVQRVSKFQSRRVAPMKISTRLNNSSRGWAYHEPA